EPMKNMVKTSHFIGSGGVFSVGTSRSVSLAGRAFKLGTRYLVPCYYASVSQASALTNQALPLAQPTYFLIDLATVDIVGELEFGTASFDWPYTAWSTNPADQYGTRFCMLPSSFVDASGIVHLTLGYASDMQNVQTG